MSFLTFPQNWEMHAVYILLRAGNLDFGMRNLQSSYVVRYMLSCAGKQPPSDIWTVVAEE